MQKNEIVTLSQKEHVLKRPGLYLGSVNKVEEKGWLFSKKTDGFELETYEYTPALVKVIREVIDNSIDEGLRTNFKFANKIDIKMGDSDTISVKDNGRGIPFKKNENGDTMAKVAWCDLNSGSNFEDSKDNKTMGQNGVGSSLSHIFSMAFKGETSDGVKKVVVSSKNNMNNIQQKITSNKQKYTKVSFTPDYKRFGVKQLSSIEERILYTDMLVLMQIYPKLSITINGELLKRKSFKEFCKGFDDSVEILEVRGLKIGVFKNIKDDFNFLHSINGLNSFQGGNPLNWVMNNILKEVKDLLPKKFSSIKVGDIKNKLSVVCLFTEMNNPRFNSQTKEKCINTYKEFCDNIGEANFKKYSKKIKSNKKIMEPITLLHSIKEQFNSLADLKALKPAKKRVFVEKYYKTSGNINKSSLVLTEGDSALSGIMSVLGREDFSFFPLKGKPLNVREQKASVINNNQEIKSILQILELDITGRSRAINHDSVLIACDADPDGMHIAGLLLNMFQRFYPKIIEDEKLKLFRTPMMVLKTKRKGGKPVLLYNFKDLFKWEEKNDISKYEASYYKGLGSWKSKDLSALIEREGIEHFVIPFKQKRDLGQLFTNWFDKGESEFRKDQIRDIQFSIEKA